MNQFAVGAVGKRITIQNLAPKPTLQPKEALELAAWLVATAAPLMPGNAADNLAKFHRLLGDAAEGDLGDEANKVAEELEG